MHEVIVIQVASERCPAIIEINGRRFFSVPPKDSADAEKINEAIQESPQQTGV